MTVKSSISLTNIQHAFAKTLVDTGRFQSVSAVIQQGLELLRQKHEADELERTALAQVLAPRRAGAFVPAGKMDERLARLVNRKRQAHGVRG